LVVYVDASNIVKPILHIYYPCLVQMPHLALEEICLPPFALLVEPITQNSWCSAEVLLSLCLSEVSSDRRRVS